MSLEDFTEKDLEDKKNIVWNDLSKNAKSVEKPHGYVLGGQPGAGKSSLTEKIRAEFQGNVIVINGDDYRKEHPRYKEIEEDSARKGINASTRTGVWAGKIVEAMLEKAADEKYNIIIEGTFRTVEAPSRTLAGLKDKGYQTTVAIKTCPAEISYASTIERAEYEKSLGGYGRLTPKSHHDLVVSSLSKNAEQVYLTGLADNFRVESREQVLYDSREDTGPFKLEIIQNELDGKNHNASLNKQSIIESVMKRKLEPGLNDTKVDKQRLLVMNGQKILQMQRDGDWKNEEVTKAGALKPGFYNIYSAQDADKSKKHDGVIVHMDKEKLYQKTGSGFVRHSRANFKKVPAVGSDVSIGYDVQNNATVSQSTKLTRGRSR